MALIHSTSEAIPVSLAPAEASLCHSGARRHGPHDIVDPDGLTDLVLAFDGNLTWPAAVHLQSVLDHATGRYDPAATPSTGTETLSDFYADLVSGKSAPERGDHAVF